MFNNELEERMEKLEDIVSIHKDSLASRGVCQVCGGIFLKNKMKKVIHYTDDCMGYQDQDFLYFCVNHTPNYDEIDDNTYKKIDTKEVEKPNYKI